MGPPFKIVQKTWETWDEFDTAYDSWKKRVDASPGEIAPFFKAGQILPDGSTVIEAVSSPLQSKIPRTSVDMNKLFKFDLKVNTPDDIKGTQARNTVFFREYIVKDVQEAKKGKKKSILVNTYRRISEQLDD